MDELSVMDGGKCILQLRGVRPFLSDKYDITRHPYYKYLSDAHRKRDIRSIPCGCERSASFPLRPSDEAVFF